MKSTLTLRPAMPPLALMYLAAPFTESTADWNSPGANGLSTSATTAMRISVGDTPTSVALFALLWALALTVPTVATAADIASAQAQIATLSRFTGSPLLHGLDFVRLRDPYLSHADPIRTAGRDRSARAGDEHPDAVRVAC